MFVFKWPGGDCWDIFRGAQLVTHQCGANEQALEAGAYTIKGKFAPVFTPFQVEIKNGASTRIEKEEPLFSTGRVVTAGTSFAGPNWSPINAVPINRHSRPAHTRSRGNSPLCSTRSRSKWQTAPGQSAVSDDVQPLWHHNRIDHVLATLTAILPAVWLSLPARASASTKSSPASARAGWARYSVRAIRSSIAMSR